MASGVLTVGKGRTVLAELVSDYVEVFVLTPFPFVYSFKGGLSVEVSKFGGFYAEPGRFVEIWYNAARISNIQRQEDNPRSLIFYSKSEGVQVSWYANVTG